MKLIKSILIVLLISTPCWCGDQKTRETRIYKPNFERAYTIRGNRIYEGSGFKRVGYVAGDRVLDTKFKEQGRFNKQDRR